MCERYTQLTSCRCVELSTTREDMGAGGGKLRYSTLHSWT